MKKWKTKSGKEIEVSKMTDTHLLSSYLMVKKQKRRIDFWIKKFEDEIDHRNEKEAYNNCCVGGVDYYGSLQE